MSNKDVSIVIPNYNGSGYVLDCIASVYGQIENKGAIIVVDDHSTDDSVEMIEKTFPDITLVKNEANFGFAGSVNRGIQLAKTEYVILLNNDAFARPGFVEALCNCIQTSDRIFSASAKILSHSNPDRIDDAGDELCLFGWAFKSGEGRIGDLYNSKRIIFSSCAGAAIFRKSIFDEIGYFDENFFAYLEDVDIGFRANIYGYYNVYCPEAKALHIGSASSGSLKYSPFKIRLTARNNLYLLYKNMPFLMLILNAPFIILGFFVKSLIFLSTGHGKSFFLGLTEGLQTLKSVRRVQHRIHFFRQYLKIEAMMATSTVRYMQSIILKVLKTARR